MTSSLQNSESSSLGDNASGDERSVKPTTSSTLSNDLLPSVVDGTTEAMLEPVNGDTVVRGDVAVRRKLSKLLKGKEEEWTAVAQRKGPLRLLDLPMDVLKEIVKEVTHTNDLTALALTHSALHNLAIPHIYSRFDIVWPDATSTADTRTGVDALTYGLATLVMGHDVFGQNSAEFLGPNGQLSARANGGAGNAAGSTGNAGLIQRRLGNNYPQFTRKFSLGNGPADWVHEYMITKESGKMLGTLVALAVARMVNLETFIWDMPTGVLRDVWQALASLQYKCAPGECRLERVLVRWHDNSLEQSPSPPNSSSNPQLAPHNPAGSTVTAIGIMLPADVGTSPHSPTTTQNQIPAHNRVESPTLSVLPPLKSLSVLDIDELAYLDEMSILIEKSKDKLQELRVGISKRAHTRPFVLAWDGPGLQQVDHDAKWPGAPSTIGEKRLGGVLGILLGRIFDIRKKPRLAARPKQRSVSISDQTSNLQQDSTVSGLPKIDVVLANAEQSSSAQTSEGTEVNMAAKLDEESITAQSPLATDAVSDLMKVVDEPLINDVPDAELSVSSNIISPAVEISQLDLSQTSLPVHNKRPHKSNSHAETKTKDTTSKVREHLDGMLRLKVLELERVPLSIAVLQKAFDWSMITSLTILDCPYHESLWRMLRKHFAPQAYHSGLASSAYSRHSISSNSGLKSIPNVPMEYKLNLKKIHTDVATPALIVFLKETLAPNTLEVLFLQDRRKNTTGTVTIDAIYKGPLRRHRRSLKKLLIDSSDKIPRSPNTSSESTRWRTWMLTHDVLAYITSGSMSSLRELSVAIDYKDWHFFLRRLPQIPTLRSLNIPFIADHVTPSYDPRELAMQVVDMIFLRPEIELCYLGISNKCFEILENRPSDDNHASTDVHGSGVDGGNADHADDEDDEDEGDGSEDEADDDEEDEEDDDDGIATEAVEAQGVEYEPTDPGDSDVESEDGLYDDRSKISLRLREILFYDDKVAIFKARHMRL